MRIRLSGVAAAAALAMSTLVAASAQATVFDFSYTFAEGFVATGVVEGTVRADGNTIDIFTVDSFIINGQSLDPATVGTVTFGPPPAIATFDGSFMDFRVTGPSPNFLSVSTDILFPLAHARLANVEDVEDYDPTRWSITEAAPAVPEPATWAMMGLGFAGLGALAYRARRKATVAA